MEGLPLDSRKISPSLQLKLLVFTRIFAKRLPVQAEATSFRFPSEDYIKIVCLTASVVNNYQILHTLEHLEVYITWKVSHFFPGDKSIFEPRLACVHSHLCGALL